MVRHPQNVCPHFESILINFGVVGRVAHPDAPEQKLAGVVCPFYNCALTMKLTLSLNYQPVYAPSAISARGGKFRFLPGAPGYVTVSGIGSFC